MAHDETLPATTQHFIDLEEQFGAHNYKPLPVVIREARGAWMTDVEVKVTRCLNRSCARCSAMSECCQ